MRSRWMLALLVGIACGDDPSGSPAGETDGTGIDGGFADTAVAEPRLDLPAPPDDPPPHAVLADPPPPPVSGGTMLASADGRWIIAADSARDAVYVVDVDTATLVHAMELPEGSEPGRVVEAPSGLVHVALRRSGEVATIDPEDGSLRAVQAVCANPRGLAVDPVDETIVVACAEGILARLHADATVETIDVGRELRDVVDVGPPLRVSTLRQPAVLTLAEDGSITDISAPRPMGLSRSLEFVPAGEEPSAEDVPDDDSGLFDRMMPNTARRTFATPDGGWLMLHQVAVTFELDQAASSYETLGCVAVQTAVISQGIPGQAVPRSVPIRTLAPSFDLALSPDRSRVALIGGDGGWKLVHVDGDDPHFHTVIIPCGVEAPTTKLPGLPTSVVFDARGHIWVQIHEPAMLVLVDGDVRDIVREVALSPVSKADSGHRMFHTATAGNVACVSCHPEGREDGLVWRFTEVGPRRTQALDIGLAGSTPFHWRGELADFAAFDEEVRVERMGGPPLPEDYVAALERWVYALPPMVPVPRADAEAIARGEALFAALGCTMCHGGDRLTNDVTTMMGEYGMLQVPSLLGVAFRAPYMHDGRAPDLGTAIDQMLPFSDPGGPIDDAQREDLVAYLQSLQAPAP